MLSNIGNNHWSARAAQIAGSLLLLLAILDLVLRIDTLGAGPVSLVDAAEDWLLFGILILTVPAGAALYQACAGDFEAPVAARFCRIGLLLAMLDATLAAASILLQLALGHAQVATGLGAIAMAGHLGGLAVFSLAVMRTEAFGTQSSLPVVMLLSGFALAMVMAGGGDGAFAWIAFPLSGAAFWFVLGSMLLIPEEPAGAVV